MPAYTLRVYKLHRGMHDATGQTEQFTAISDDDAQDRMRIYARDNVSRRLVVHLYRDGVARSIASEEGLA